MIQTRLHNDKIQVLVPKNSNVSKRLQEEFSVFKPGYQFDIRYRMGKTDGKKRFFKSYLIEDKILFEFELGFLNRLKKIIPLDLELKTEYTKEEILDFLKSEIKNLPFKPRKYQLKAVLNALQNKRHLIKAATGSGKSLIFYLIIKFLYQKNKRVVLIVPTIGLVTQAFSDMEEYRAPKDFLNSIQLIGGEFTDKEIKKPIVISTWQSLSKVKFNADCIIVDEVHTAKADVLQSIIKKKIPQKIGMTGTIPIVKIDGMKLEETFGEYTTYTTAKDLIELGLLTKTVIVAVFLNYPKKYTRSGIKYQQESKLIRELPQRIDFTQKMIKKVSEKGITIAVYNTTKFGETLYETLTNSKLKKNDFDYQKQLGVFFISGTTKSTVREQIREYLNSNESKNEILIAQSTTISTGINLPKLTNLVFAEMPGKSFTKILQSIGRVMRKSKDKGNTVYVWDIVDVFPYKTENYSMKHFWERVEYYNSEQHEIIEIEKQLE